MNGTLDRLALDIEDDRQQRAGLFLRDVRYRLHARFELLGKAENPAKYSEMFERRARKGQCFNQPYLGCREFSCDFRPATDDTPAPIAESCALGWMLYDLDYSDPKSPTPRFFNARMENGVIEVPEWNSEEVRV